MQNHDEDADEIPAHLREILRSAGERARSFSTPPASNPFADLDDLAVVDADAPISPGERLVPRRGLGRGPGKPATPDRLRAALQAAGIDGPLADAVEDAAALQEAAGAAQAVAPPPAFMSGEEDPDDADDVAYWPRAESIADRLRASAGDAHLDEEGRAICDRVHARLFPGLRT